MAQFDPTSALLMAETAAIVAVQAYQRAFRERDARAMASTLNYPYVRMVHGTAEVFATREAFIAGQENRFRMLAQEGWRTAGTRSLQILQSSEDKVHLAISNEHLGQDGAPYARVDMVWVITRQNGSWGVQVHSSIERPLFE